MTNNKPTRVKVNGILYEQHYEPWNTLKPSTCYTKCQIYLDNKPLCRGVPPCLFGNKDKSPKFHELCCKPLDEGRSVWFEKVKQ